MGFYRGPNIVTDGLVYAIDAGSERSYPGSGTAVTAITGVGNGTLQNGIGFDSANGGSWTFDGVDQYVDFGSNFLLPGVAQFDTITELTIDVWVNYDAFVSSGANSQIISWWKTGGSTYADGFLGITIGGAGTAANPMIRFGDGWANTGVTFTASTDVNKWFHIVAVKTSNNAYLYVNGVLKSTKGSALSFGFNEFPSLGRQNLAGEYLDGDISNIKLYNQALTATEVLQNYNAQKSRFI